jgi:hypothetical protein
MIIFRKERLETELAALRNEWRSQMERSLKRVADEAVARIKRDSEDLEEGIASRLGGMREALTDTAVQTEARLNTLHEALGRESERSHRALLELETAEERINDRAAKLAEATSELDLKLSGLRQYLDDQNDRLHESLRQLQAADQRLSEQLSRLDQLAQAAGQNLESRATAVLDASGQEMTRRAEATMAAWAEQIRVIREASGHEMDRFSTQLQAADQRLSEQLSRLDQLAQAAAQDLESRATAVLDASGQEMTRRAEATVAAWAEQIRVIREASGHEMDSFSTQLKNELSSRLDSTHETLKNIETATTAAQESLRSTQESLASVSEQALEAVAGRIQALTQDLIGNSERQLEESGRAATAKWIAALEDKATDATYTAFGSLFKVSEWCEKKAQMRMQEALEKGLNVASDNVREKAEAALRDFSAQVEVATGKISAFIDAERTQIRSAWQTEAEELASRLRAAFTEDANATLNRASQDLLNQVSSMLDTVRAETLAQENRLKQALAQLGDQAMQAHEMRIEAERTQIRAAWQTEAEELASRLRTAFTEDANATLNRASQDLLNQVSSALDTVRAETLAQESRLKEAFAQLGGQAIQAHEAERAQIRAAWQTEAEELASRLRTVLTEDGQATLNSTRQDLLNQMSSMLDTVRAETLAQENRLKEAFAQLGDQAMQAHEMRQAALNDTRQDLLNQVSSVLDTVRAETLAQENRLKQALAQLGDQAIQAHEMRLDQVSRASLQEAIGKFSQESSEHLESLVRSAEQRLRFTCNEVFTEVGEALRQRLLELTFARPAVKAATESS